MSLFTIHFQNSYFLVKPWSIVFGQYECKTIKMIHKKVGQNFGTYQNMKNISNIRRKVSFTVIRSFSHQLCSLVERMAL